MPCSAACVPLLRAAAAAPPHRGRARRACCAPVACLPRRAVVTVAVVLEPAMGGLILKSGLRVAGTTLAGFLGVG